MRPQSAEIEIGQLPNFLVIGAMKAGTTSLYHYLRAHPQVFMPTVKELDFFARPPDETRGIEWYRRQFTGAGRDTVAIGEASTLYSKYPRFPGVPERISVHVPEAKLVYVIRDPIERIRSHYQHRVANGAERLPFERAVFEDPVYLDVSRYAMQIDRYLGCFDRDQLLIITAEGLRDRRAAVVRDVYRFLGVDADFVPPNLATEFYRTEGRTTHHPLVWRVRRNVKRRFPALKRVKELVDAPALRRKRDALPGGRGPGSLVIADDTRRRLVRILHEDVRRLRDHLGSDFDGWGIA